MSRLWEKLGTSGILKQSIYEWFKLVCLCMVMVLGSVEDERMLSNLAFVKSKLWNWLTLHLDLVVRMYAHEFYSMETFPFYISIHARKEEQHYYGMTK
jgi:hypothetical protein